MYGIEKEVVRPEYAAIVYAIYAFVAAVLVIYLSKVLTKYGSVFLKNIFVHEEGMAGAINKLLATGFLMLNLGFAFMIIESETPETVNELVVALVQKLGALAFCLGIIHLINVTVFYKIRRANDAKLSLPPPPNLPQSYYQNAPQ